MLGQAWRHFRDSLQVFAKFIVTILICCSQSLHICTIRRHNLFFLPHTEAHSLQHQNPLPDSLSQSFFTVFLSLQNPDSQSLPYSLSFCSKHLFCCSLLYPFLPHFEKHHCQLHHPCPHSLCQLCSPPHHHSLL